MADNQIPQLYTITSGQTLTITIARSISVLSQGGNSTVVNSNSQSMTLGDGTTLELNADNGNTLTQVVITSAATALVTTIGGICVIS